MIAISVVFEVDPAHKDEFLSLSLAHAQNAKAREEGCLDFRIFRNQENPNTFYFHETYKDQAAVDLHMKTDYLAALIATITPWVKTQDMRFWESVN